MGAAEQLNNQSSSSLLGFERFSSGKTEETRIEYLNDDHHNNGLVSNRVNRKGRVLDFSGAEPSYGFDSTRELHTREQSDQNFIGKIIDELASDPSITEVFITLPYTKNLTTIRIKRESRRMEGLRMNFNVFKYYTFIWVFCALLFGVFATSGIVGILGPISAVSGSLMSIAGIVAGVLDWKEREKNHAV